MKEYWRVQMNGNKFATDQILKKKTSRSCEGADFSWSSSKVSRTLACSPTLISGSEWANSVHCCPPPVGVGMVLDYVKTFTPKTRFSVTYTSHHLPTPIIVL
jgi:hypothetical protein